MKKAKNNIRTILALILIIVALIMIVVSLFGESAVKAAVKKGGTKALGVDVDLKGVTMSLIRGKVTMKGLSVANPEGYENKTLLELKKGMVDASLGSLMSETVEIETIDFDGMVLTIEQKGLSNNLQDIINNIPKSAPKETPEKPKKDGKAIKIKELKITNTKVNVILPPAEPITLDLNPIEMQNLGSKDKMTVAKLSAEILLVLATAVAEQGADQLPAEMIKSIEGSLENVTKMADEFKKEIESSKKEVEKILEGVGGLLGDKKEQ